jgi:hypothetical protein
MLKTMKPAKRIPGRNFLGEQDSLLGFRCGRKTISVIETLMCWVILNSFDGFAGDEGYGPKDEF